MSRAENRQVRSVSRDFREPQLALRNDLGQARSQRRDNLLAFRLTKRHRFQRSCDLVLQPAKTIRCRCGFWIEQKTVRDKGVNGRETDWPDRLENISALRVVYIQAQSKPGEGPAQLFRLLAEFPRFPGCQEPPIQILQIGGTTGLPRSELMKIHGQLTPAKHPSQTRFNPGASGYGVSDHSGFNRRL